MLGRKSRTIRRLQRHNDVLTEHNEQLKQERDAAVYVNGRLSARLTEATNRLVARNATQAEGLFPRAIDLLRRREQRHQAAVAALRRELTVARVRGATEKDRADKLDDWLRHLERANQETDWRYANPDVPESAAA